MEKIKIIKRLGEACTSPDTEHESYQRQLKCSEVLLGKFNTRLEEVDELLSNLPNIRAVWPGRMVVLLDNVEKYKNLPRS